MDTAALSAFGIIFREGLEALLMVTALAAYLNKTGQGARTPVLWGGAACGVAGSFGLAWLLSGLAVTGHNHLLEGTTMFAAALVMLYVSGWMFIKQDPISWKNFLHRKADTAANDGGILAMGTLAFLAVAREGAESVLFVLALAQGSGGYTAGLLGGVLAALVLLGVFAVIMRKAWLRVPLRPLFLFTSAFLFLMGLHFIAEGMEGLQSAGLIPSTPTIFGDELNLESVATILLVALVAVGGTLWARNRAQHTI